MANPDHLKSALGKNSTFQMQLKNYRRDFGQLLNKRNIDPIESWLNKPISVESIASCLSYYYKDFPITILLYFYEKEELVIWCINKDGLQVMVSNKVAAAKLLSLEAAFKQTLSTDNNRQYSRLFKRGTVEREAYEAIEEKEFLPIIQELSDYLFPKELTEVLIDLNLEHLIIVPALNIQQIPLYLLTPFGDERQIIDEWSYSIAASIYEIADLILKKQTTESEEVYLSADTFSDQSLFVGNPIFSDQNEWVLADLPGAAKEVASITHKYAVPLEQVLIGAAATKEKVLAQSQNPAILYFATHGIADPKNPLDGSGLFLTPDQSDSKGFWTSREIQTTKLKADLVILSACQTGLGLSEDAGVIGLSRAFHLAGAGNIIMSLWSVDDEATSKLMEIFMEKLLEPQRFFPSSNLRQAMLAYRELDSNPLFWASFCHMGIPY